MNNLVNNLQQTFLLFSASIIKFAQIHIFIIFSLHRLIGLYSHKNYIRRLQLNGFNGVLQKVTGTYVWWLNSFVKLQLGTRKLRNTVGDIAICVIISVCAFAKD